MCVTGFIMLPQQQSVAVCLQAPYLCMDMHKIYLLLKEASCDLLYVVHLLPSPTKEHYWQPCWKLCRCFYHIIEALYLRESSQSRCSFCVYTLYFPLQTLLLHKQQIVLLLFFSLKEKKCLILMMLAFFPECLMSSLPSSLTLLSAGVLSLFLRLSITYLSLDRISLFLNLLYCSHFHFKSPLLCPPTFIKAAMPSLALLSQELIQWI